MEYVTYEQLTNDDKSQLEKILRGCFQKRVSLPADYKYLLSKTVDQINATAAVKYDIASKTASIWSVCSSAVGKINHATRPLLEYGLHQIFLEEPFVWLVLEYENPYWSQALALYTSLGFTNIITTSTQFSYLIDKNISSFKNTTRPSSTKNIDYFLKRGIILYTTSELFYSDTWKNNIIAARTKADLLRKNKFPTEYGGLGLTAAMARFGREIVKYGKEYAGYLTVDKSFDVIGLGNLTGGNPIYQTDDYPAISEIYDNSKFSLFHFHTHPAITNLNNNLEFNPPSYADMVYLLSGCGKNFVRGYIFSVNGLFSFALTKYAQQLFCVGKSSGNPKLSNAEKEYILGQYVAIVNSLVDINTDKNSVLGNHYSASQVEDILIDHFISSVLSIEINDHPVFDIKYWTYNFIESKGTVVDTFFVTQDLKITNAGSATPSILFSRWNDYDFFDAIDQGERVKCNRGYLAFLLGGTNKSARGKLEDCLPYTFVDLDLLVAKYIEDKDSVDLLIRLGTPLKDIIGNSSRPKISF